MTEFEQKQIEQLTRIGNVLEDMNGALVGMQADIEALGKCVGYEPPRYYMKEGYYFLRIAGGVDTQ